MAVLILAGVVYLMIFIHSFLCPKHPHVLNVYFGVPGSGKTTFAAYLTKWALHENALIRFARKHSNWALCNALLNSKYLKRRIDVYSNVPITGAYQLDAKSDIGKYMIEDAKVIIDEAGITPDDFVLEIGPGIGTMTQYLAEAAREVVAVEIDKTLIPILENDTLKDWDNVTVINEDILKVDIAALAQEKNGGKPIKVVANLPYYITTPIIMGLFENHVPISSITIMVQKEVADRMQVGPGTKDYGALSLAVQFYSKAEIVANVPANCFMPRPNVGSAVIRLTCHAERPVDVKDEAFMFKIIRASFNQRRKTLVNGLYNVGGLNKSKEELAAVLESIGLAANVRGETLTLEQFAALSDALSKSAN